MVACRCVVLAVIIAFCVGCMLYRWEPYYVAYGWSREGSPVLLQWIGTGYQVTVGHGISGTPTTGHYRLRISNGSARDFTIPSFGKCYYPEGPVSRWYKLVDEHNLIVIGPECGGSQKRAVLYNISSNVIEKNIDLPTLPPNRMFDADVSDDLSVLAMSTSEGITIIELLNGAQRKYLSGRRVRNIHLSQDGKRLAALVRFSKKDATILPFIEKFAEVSLHNDEWRFGDNKGPLSSYYVGVLVISVASGAITDVFRPFDVEPHAFVDDTYRQLRPFEYNFERPARDFCFCRDTNELILQDSKRHYTYKGMEYSMWRGPYCSSNPRKVGFYNQIIKKEHNDGKLVSLFWLNQGTETFSQVERQ